MKTCQRRRKRIVRFIVELLLRLYDVIFIDALVTDTLRGDNVH